MVPSFAGAEQAAQARAKIEALPLVFEHNQGQTDARVKFLSRGNGYTVFLTPSEMVLRLANPETHAAGVLRVSLAGASREPQITGKQELPGKANYLVGNDPAQWRANVATYAKVEYASVYPGIDLVYYGKGKTIEYDFVVAPNANPELITLAVEGADQLALDAAGDLVLQMGSGELRMHKPLVYQEVNGKREPIAGHYILKGANQVGFQLAAYDPSRALVIDPVLVYSTFLGGSGTDEGLAIAADSFGNVYVTGGTQSANFPAVAAYDTSIGGNTDAFVTKFNSNGTVAFSTYLGGGSPDKGLGIAVDLNNPPNIFVTGLTQSSNYPVTTGAFSASSRGSTDAFVTKLNPSGSGLVYSTFLGGNKLDQGNAIAVDGTGRIYVTGSTTSAGPSNPFPTIGSGSDTTQNGGVDAFLAVLDPSISGTAGLVYSTFLGGTGDDSGNGIAVYGSNVYVTGSIGTNAFVAKFPTPGGAPVFFPTLTTAAGNAIAVAADGLNVYVTGSSGANAFVAKYLASTGATQYSSSLTGVAGKGIAVDSAGNAYVTGSTASAGLATAGSFQTANGGLQDAFVAMFSSTGSRIYFTYLGGSGNDVGNGIAAKATGGVAYVTGTTASNNFPTSPADNAPAYASCGNPANSCTSTLTDAFVTVLKLDITPPTLTLATPANGIFTNNSTALAFSGSAGTAPGDLPTITIKIYSGTSATGTPVQTLTANGSSGTYTVNGAIGPGTYTAQAQQSDEAGNTGFSSANTFIIDTTAPGVTVSLAAGQPARTKTSPINFTVSFSEEVLGFNASKVTITGGSVSAVGAGPVANSYNVTVTGMTTTGPVTASVAAGAVTDRAGNGNTASNSATVNWDVTAPIVTLTTPVAGSTTNGTPAFTGSAGTLPGDLPTVTVKVYSGTSATGTPLQTLSANGSSGTYSVTAAALVDGSYTGQAEQSDDLGNKGVSSANTFSVDATPPVFGPVTNFMFQTGTTVTYPTPVAIDAVSGLAAVSCTPASGTTAGSGPFPLGDTTVTCTATDAAGNQSTIDFLVTVTTTAPPALSVTAGDLTVKRGAPIPLTAVINVSQSTLTIAPDCVNTTWTIKRADGSVVAPKVPEKIYGIPNDLVTLVYGVPTVVSCDIIKEAAIDPALLPPGSYRYFATHSNYIRDPDCTPGNCTPPAAYDVWIGSVRSLEANLTITEESVMQVGMDVKPGSAVNSWNCDSSGTNPVAIVSGEIYDPAAPAPTYRRMFDPVSEVNAASVRFGKTGTEMSDSKPGTADVNGDGVADLVFHFPIVGSGFSCTDIPAGSQDTQVTGIVTGVTKGGAAFAGSDGIRLVTGTNSK